MVTPEARKTPRGARPNRRGEPARLDERAFERGRVPFAVAQAIGDENPRVGCWSRGANRDLEE